MKFQFEDQNSKLISLDHLRQSATLSEATGRMPHTRPIEHYELIDRVIETLESERVLTELPQIYVSKSGNNPIKRKGQVEPDYELDNWLFQRLVVKLPLATYQNDNYQGAIALGYNESGIQLAWGTDVRVCSNMSIFGNQFMTTYGKNRINDMNKFFDVLRVWSKHAALKNDFDLAVFKVMIERHVDWTEIPDMVGWMSLKATKAAYLRGDTAPLNIGQISEFCTSIHKSNILQQEEETTSFNLYNIGTRILTPEGTNDLSTIWEKNVLWGMFIMQHFMLQEHEVFQDAKYEILNTI